MEIVTYLTCFVVGVIAGMVSVVAFAYAAADSEKKQRQVLAAEKQRREDELVAKYMEELSKALPPAPIVPPPTVEVSVKERLRKAVEITLKQQQIDLRKGDDQLILNNELELQKLNILRTILSDGFDPMITIRYSSGEQEMLLSKYIEGIKKGLH